MALGSLPAYSGYRCGNRRKAYNEPAFRYFLANERTRAERSARSLLLVLVKFKNRPGVTATFTPRTAAAVFSALGGCFREVDVMGWYHEGRVAAAVLPLNTTASNDVRRHMTDRVFRLLHAHLPSDQTARLCVRIVLLSGTGRS
jgi:hypothetical protein